MSAETRKTAKKITDTDRINVLEQLLKAKSKSGKCMLKISGNETGWSLYESSHDDASDTVREAIDDFIEREEWVI